jgi:hypothetical protein
MEAVNRKDSRTSLGLETGATMKRAIEGVVQLPRGTLCLKSRANHVITSRRGVITNANLTRFTRTYKASTYT